MEQAQTILDLWRMFRRRFWILAGIGALGILASGFIAYVLPPVYQAQAKILVESQQIPDDLARSTVAASAAERLQLIQQRLMTRDNLLRLIDELKLFQDRPDLSPSQKIEHLRKATDFWPVALNAPGRRGGDISAFTINVVFNDANAAARVANELATTVLSQNIRSRSQRASETLDFFVKEQQRLTGELSSIEAEITAFKKEHEGALPDSLEFRRDQLAQMVESDRKIDQRLLEVQEKRGALEASLHEAAIADPPAMSAEEQQLRKLETQLAQSRAVYAESHPEIRKLKAQIAALRASLPAVAKESGGADPKEIRIASIRKQLDILDAQTALLRKDKEQLARTRADLQASINETPKIEMQMNALKRHHAELQAQYAEIVQKRTEAETGEKLEVNQQSERFEIIENAIVPDEPISPERKKVVVLGSAMTLALALGVAYLIEILFPAIRSAAQMERQLELRPVVSIPYITTRSERRWRGIRIAAFLIVVFVGVPAALYAIDQYYMPLQLIGAKIADQSGLDEIIRTVGKRL